MRSPRRKGQRGEREVAALFRTGGFPRAAPSPGSGSLRPWGAGDLSPWPGDLVYSGRWLVEVKYDERVNASSRGWRGEAFIRAVAKDLDKLQVRHSGIIGRPDPFPVLFARANHIDWRVYVPSSLFAKALGFDQVVTWNPDEWVEVDPVFFFEHLATLDG